MTVETASDRTQAVPDIIQRILEARGVEPGEMASFLYPAYEAGVHDPYLLTDMERAVDRLVQARDKAENVAVYGDYDIDGITATVVMVEALEANGIKARAYIPDRFYEGYGINETALGSLLSDGVSLVVSVDCGITAVDEAAWAMEHGLDLIITDHHSVPPTIPEAIAVINPKRLDDAYPFKDLAGVAVAFKVASALQVRTGKPAAGQEKWWLDLVALGTVCDVVPLVGENRVLASFGLKVLRRTRRQGLAALAEVAGVSLHKLKAHDLGYVLGPRMNAAGRLEHAARSLELVRTSDARRGATIAGELDSLNRRRRADQEAIFMAADEMAQSMTDDPVLVLADSSWSHGIVGIVASKLADKWQKPALVGQILGDIVKGSARSVPGFNLVEALRDNEELLIKYGGHFFAAGFTLEVSQLVAFRSGMAASYRQRAVSQLPEQSGPVCDLTLDSWSEAGLDQLRHLALLEPFGSGNPPPLMEISGLKLERISFIGADGKHLKLLLADGNGQSMNAVAFGMSQRYRDLKVGARLMARGELNINEWRGVESPQLIVRELVYESV